MVRTYLLNVEAGADVDEDFVAVGELGGDVEGAGEWDEEFGICEGGVGGWGLGQRMGGGVEDGKDGLGDGLGWEMRWAEWRSWLFVRFLFLFLSSHLSHPRFALRRDADPTRRVLVLLALKSALTGRDEGGTAGVTMYIYTTSGTRALTFPLVPDAPLNAADAFPEALLSGPEPRMRRAQVFEFL